MQPGHRDTLLGRSDTDVLLAQGRGTTEESPEPGSGDGNYIDTEFQPDIIDHQGFLLLVVKHKLKAMPPTPSTLPKSSGVILQAMQNLTKPENPLKHLVFQHVPSKFALK